MNWQLAAFAFVTGVTLYAAYRVATDETVSHAALYLVIAAAGVAGYYVLLGAEFLAAVQVLVYAGAVMTVMVFAIMLSDIKEVRGHRLPLFARLASPRWGFLPALIAAGLAVALIAAYAAMPVFSQPGPPRAGVRELGESLLTTYVAPFEVASVLLLAAMIGAIVITKRDGEE